MRLYALAFVLPLAFIGPCDDSEKVIPVGTCIKVSYVKGMCMEAVLQVVDERYVSLAEDWQGTENVFYGIFPCGTDWDKVSSGPFYVQILKEPEQPSCVRCMATINYTGEKMYDVRVVDSCGN